MYSHFALHQETCYVTRSLAFPFLFFSLLFSLFFFLFATRNYIAFLNRDLFPYSFSPLDGFLMGSSYNVVVSPVSPGRE